ncbi:MAG TPA: RNA methyltransferase, partial [Acidimicrobiia bacterium]|nr:RNA methyltransferase [Acidimicrobiia bacterium]
VLVAVDVADPGNLGTIIRSAEAAGAAAVVVTGASVDAYNPKTVRSSAGAIVGLPILEQPDPAGALDALHDRGRHTVGTAATGGRDGDTLDVTTPIALVVGNEAHGLAPDVQARLDEIVTIPMHGAADSLNVAMAATVLLFDLDRRRTRTPTGPTR